MPVSAQFRHHDEDCWRAGLIIRRSWVRVPPAHFPETQIRACDLRKRLTFVIFDSARLCAVSGGQMQVAANSYQVVQASYAPRLTRGRGAGHIVPGATPSSRYLAANRRLVSPAIGSFFLKTALLLADITFVSKAIWTTMVANAFDMNVRTVGSLLSRLSHQRKGLSTQPPSKLGMLPSKLPR